MANTDSRSILTGSKKSDMMLSTPYLDTCCHVLESHMEYPGDIYLVQLVRIQQLSQSISVVPSLRGISTPNDLPPNIVAKTLQQQIDSYRSRIPEHLKDNRE